MIESDVEVELARHQWEDGRRAFARASSDHVRADALARQVELISAELTRRLGLVFTLAELAAVYRDADRWSHALLLDALDEVPLHAAAVADTAFAQHARRASDYAP